MFSKNFQLNFQKKMFRRSLKANEKKIKFISIQIIYLAVKILSLKIKIKRKEKMDKYDE